MRRALITGITGQDGSYLAELLLGKGYRVHGITRPNTHIGTTCLRVLSEKVEIHPVSLDETDAIERVIGKVLPDELYHLAGQTQVEESLRHPLDSISTNGLATLRLLEICRAADRPPRFFFASSSQVFGIPEKEPQDESTPFRPVNPYGASKALATDLVRIYRDVHGLFSVSGILFNHESPRRPRHFVTAKICHAAAAIRLGRQKELVLGDLSAQRDWGHARDYVEGFWLALQAERPADYVFATGALHSVQEVAEIAFATVGLEASRFVRSDPSFFRKAEARRLVGDATLARSTLGWSPRIPFAELIADMTRTALAEMENSEGTKLRR